MAIEYINPLDLRKIFVDYFLGSSQLFTYAFVFLFSFICAYFQMSSRVFMVLLVLSSLIFSFMLGQPIYILIILVVGYISFKSLARILT